mgnify:FL=1
MLKDTNSLRKAIETITEFSKVAGPKLNLEKTECLLTGSFIDMYSNDSHIHGIKITKTCIKSLGIYLGHDKTVCYEKNWISKLEKLEKILSVWKRRNLTIFGKCTVVNTLAISKILYNANILENPKSDFFKAASKLIYNFIWKKRDRIKRNTLIGKIEQGGIGVINIESKFHAAKASWISRILNENSVIHRALSAVMRQYKLTISDILKTTEYNFLESSFFKMLKLPVFYGNVFSAFNRCKKQKNVNTLNRDEFLSQFIWNNNLFQYENKPLCFENWIKSGILYVKDIFDENGEFYDMMYFTQKLVRKNNILCEYIMLRKAFKAYKEKFDCSYSKYVKIKHCVSFLFRNNTVNSVNNVKHNFYYSLFIDKKFQKPIYEIRWRKIFNDTLCLWENVYIAKIKEIYEKRISEFNYKLLHGILNNNVCVSKWNKTVSPLCEVCNVNEDIKHLLYDCKIVKHIWERISIYLKFDVTWKIVVLCLYNLISEKTSF